MQITEEMKDDIIAILNELMDEAVPGNVYDFDGMQEYRYCRLCSGTSDYLLISRRKSKTPQDYVVEHKDNCPVLKARVILDIFNQEGMSDNDEEQ